MYYLLLFILVISLPLEAVKTKKEQMLCELETVANFFEVCYGPKEHKSDNYQWDPAAELEKGRNLVVYRDNMSTKEFHQVLLQYCQSTKDYHVSVSFCSTESSHLPLRIKHADGRYFIMDADTSLAVSEIILFDGLPVHYVVESLQKRFFNYTNGMTDKAIATQLLTHRLGEMGLPTPKGKVKLVLRVNGQDEPIEMKWEHVDELIANSVVPHKKKGHKWTNHEFTTPYYYLMEDSNLFASPNSYVPAFGKPLWVAPGGINNPFNAAIYEIDSGEKIGYIRIPHYMGSSNDAELFRQIIGHLQKKTEALVIDQTGNPGGYALYMMALTSMLTDEPIPNIKESILLNHAEIADAVDELVELGEEDALLFLKSNSVGYPFAKSDIKPIQNHLKKLIRDWNENKVYSDIAPFYGLTHIRPHPKTHYSKPIIVLVNELCFSCGDVFPALLQDSKRATIFGQTTAGAGGSVAGIEYPNHLGVSQISITRSILHRLDDKFIENVGVVPDIFYTITPEDLASGFQGYRAALLDAIQLELKKKETLENETVNQDSQRAIRKA